MLYESHLVLCLSVELVRDLTDINLRVDSECFEKSVKASCYVDLPVCRRDISSSSIKPVKLCRRECEKLFPVCRPEFGGTLALLVLYLVTFISKFIIPLLSICMMISSVTDVLSNGLIIDLYILIFILAAISSYEDKCGLSGSRVFIHCR